MQSFDLIIIGGGPSGMAAALSAARENPNLKIAVVERQSRVGKKLLATGNGRCNILHSDESPGRLHSGQPAFVKTVFSKVDNRRILSFFAQMGLDVLEQEDGRMYPASLQASSVVDALRLAMQEYGVVEVCGWEATKIQPKSGGFALASGQESLLCKSVVLACGGIAAPSLGGVRLGYDLLSSLGHKITPLFPTITQLKTETGSISMLKGVRLIGAARIFEGERCLKEESGELLFTQYGVSGPPILQLSRIASAGHKKNLSLSLNFLPGCTQEEAAARLRDRKALLPNRPADAFLTGMVHSRVNQCALKAAGLWRAQMRAGELRQGHIQALARALCDLRIPITGTQGFEQAQATAGGAALSDFWPETMMSRRLPGLFACGEVLDVDGDCGGFNLRWAWASGMLAGVSAARHIFGASEEKP